MNQKDNMPDIPEKYLSPYNPEEVEDKIYKSWEESGYFNPDVCVEKGVTNEKAETFSIVLPPPNVTGTLHTGHSMMVAIEDALTRYNRMLGKKTLWIPGTDHAAIATESKVVKNLQKQKIKKSDLSRNEFLDEVNKFAQESHDTIVSQIKKVGASLDWSREAYTLDDERELAVRTAFKRMYDMGLIYRGNRVINWDPKAQTTISDDEVVHEEQKGVLYTFKYSEDFPIPIATTRPETKLGDTAVAVNPNDDRYKEYIGKEFTGIQFSGEKLSIKVVGDDTVDPEFGTGAVGVTPAHSYTDWQIGQRHNLPMKQIINEYGKMEVSGPTNGLKTSDAREKVVEWLEENSLLIETEEIEQNISISERSGAVVEPLPKLQWFVDVNKPFTLPNSKEKEMTLREWMKSVVEDSLIEIIPERFEKTYYHWIENLHDWCISRQILFGHRIPVWYRPSGTGNDEEQEIYVGIEPPEGDDWEQDTDTLDTWFSSGLWTFSTLGWPEKTSDLNDYHPTDLLETGYDILFFWVARMILMSGCLLGEIPFRQVYLHGLVRDEKGRKMSKSLGNIIDPVDLIDQYGSDALRMALLVGVGPGSDSNLGGEKVKAYKHFSNKLWNIARFVLSNTSDAPAERPSLSEKDKKRIEALDNVTKEVDGYIKEMKMHLATEKLYHYVWHEFADVILEESKEILENGTDEERISTQWTLMHILRTSVKLLHPFMPFITEEIWKDIKSEDEELLLVESWPVV